MSTLPFAGIIRPRAIAWLVALAVPWHFLCAQVTVTPRGTSVQVAPNTSGNSVNFTVKNTGATTEAFTISCLTDVYVPTCSAPSSVGPLSHNQSATVTVTYSTATSGSGLLTLDATGNVTHSLGEGFFNISPPAAPPSPIASDQPYGDYRSPQLCVANCFENVVSYSTPAYVSMDVARSLTLVYRSNQAHPSATVLVDAVDNGSPSALQYSLIVQKSGVNVTFINGGAGTQELFFADGTGGTIRLAGTFDVSSLSTGVYPYTAVVKRWTDAVNFTTSNLTFWLIVLNEGSSAYGAGWSIAGAQRLFVQSSPAGVLAIDGAGGAAFFRGSCPSTGTCTFSSPSADFSTLRHLGADNTYRRTYPDGSVVTFGSDGKITSTCDRFNNCTSFSFNGSGLLATVSDPTSTSISLAYAGAPSVLSTITVPGGGASRTSTFSISSSNLNSIQDPDNISTSFSYDANHWLTQTTDRRGKAWNYAYKSDGTLDSLQAPTITVSGAAARPTARLSAASMRIIDSITRASYGTTSKLVPRSIDLRATITNPRGYATYSILDNFSAAKLIAEPLSRTSNFSRNSSGQLTYSRSPSGAGVVYKWSGPDLVSVYDSVTTRRDTMIYEQTYHQLTSRSDGATKDSLYWSSGKLDSLDASQPGSTYRSHYYYESISGRITGRVNRVVDPRGHTRSYVYRTSGLLNKRADSIPGTSGGTPQVWKHGYDGAGRIVSDTDALGNVRLTAYDSLNRPVRRIGPSPVFDTTTFAYDALNLTTVTDAQGQVYRGAPNAIGWDTVRVDPLGQLDSLRYDLNGNVVALVNRNLKTISYQYDQLDKPTSRTADGATTTFVVDPSGRFTTVSNFESTDSSAFDAAGRLISEVAKRGANSYTRLSSYNAYGQRTSLVLQPWADTARFHFDALLRLDTLTDFNGAKTIVTFNVDNQPGGLQLPAPSSSPISITRDYPGEHTPFQITYGSSGVNYQLGLYFTYSKLGQVMQRIFAGQTTSTFSVGRDLSFDVQGRVSGYQNWSARISGDNCLQPGIEVDPNTGQACYTTDSTSYGDNASYSYDKVGNRTDLGGNTTTGNRLQAFDGRTFTYDSVGNLRQRLQSGNPLQSLVWNSLGQLVSVKTSSDSISFGYDGLGRRVRKTTQSGTKYYLQDGDNLLAEVDASGNRVAEYTSYPGQVDLPHSLRRWTGGTATTYYYATDVPGSVTGLIRSDGALVSQYFYRPFGAMVSSDNYSAPGGPFPSVDTAANPLKFAAREYDSETGLYFMRARYYDPALGRFISEDPIGLDGGINLYAYSNNDPVSSRDIYGACPEGDPAHGAVLATVVICEDPWPFSTPRANGNTGNFLNPNARGGPGIGSGPGGGGGQGSTCGYACGKGIGPVPPATYRPMNLVEKCMQDSPAFDLAALVLSASLVVQVKAPGQWRPGQSFFGNVDRRFPNLPGADPDGGMFIRTAGKVERPKFAGRYGTAVIGAGVIAGAVMGLELYRCGTN